MNLNFNVFTHVLKGINQFFLFSANKIKVILPLNLPRVNKIYLVDIFDNHLIHYSSPISLTYA